MAKKLPEELISLMKKDLLLGASVKDVAETFKVSEKTVRRYKKSLPESLDSNSEAISIDSIQFDYKNYNTILTKREQVYTKKLVNQIHLFEDIEEGWCYHLTKSDYRLKTSGLWWAFIVYPESAPKNWKQNLQMLHLPFAVSPLHDKDSWDHDSQPKIALEDFTMKDGTVIKAGEMIPEGGIYQTGDNKKAHWHVLVLCAVQTSAVEINNLVRPITNSPYAIKVRSVMNYYQYFLHINHPNKYQGYDKDEIETYNNFHITPNKYEVGVMQNEILQDIKKYNLDTMADMIEHYLDQPEYITILTSKPGLFTAYVNALYKKNHPESVVKRVYNLSTDEYRELVESKTKDKRRRK